ncbi:hypothetical protein BKA65DRAFT_270254 [Rhexocercosporidium sp. MPI-PUGE-AT-0058]|nr:hypothetical protein BKA65DRAFT_270254 [Rhexocercosporidium sp. MPI-PUGE-AT-0058]
MISIANEGGIRQAWRNPLHQKQWLGGEQKDIVCLGKRFTPIAATSWLSGQGLNIRVYYLDKDNYVRERICVDPRYQQRDPDWEDEPRWTPGELNVFNFRAASHSQLAVTSWGDGHISLCYQDTNQTICELRGIWDDRGPAIWRKSLQLYDAIVATSLAITTFNIGREGKKGIRLIYQGVDRNIREQIWDDGELFSSRRSKIEILPGASIAAIKLRSNHTQVVLSSPSITFRSLVATVPRSWTAVQVERIGKPLGTQLAVIRDQADYRVYSFTADGCLIETRKWDGEWDGHLILYCDEALRAAAGEN